ncbi:GMC oxidoreductase [Myriangium duriaei CBS 260.36]|uniref:GMC oxidoreductase n=1 Tax=Myriangium duriaei CBS 260.36 TaxID=1168546 RepID=A0A9P4MJS6_9PEZI|nr:GMC oxidoreductase [Myriangium duriaei CBS 260.36]
MAYFLFTASILISFTSSLPLNSPLKSSYDYISKSAHLTVTSCAFLTQHNSVVGGGPAGLVTANRLTEDPAITVLVIEAGQADQAEPAVQSPFLAGQTVGGPYDWNLTAAPQGFLDGSRRPLPQGHVLGGSSVISAML